MPYASELSEAAVGCGDPGPRCLLCCKRSDRGLHYAVLWRVIRKFIKPAASTTVPIQETHVCLNEVDCAPDGHDLLYMLLVPTLEAPPAQPMHTRNQYPRKQVCELSDTRGGNVGELSLG